jgi:hypothetical protein
LAHYLRRPVGAASLCLGHLRFIPAASNLIQGSTSKQIVHGGPDERRLVPIFG